MTEVKQWSTQSFEIKERIISLHPHINDRQSASDHRLGGDSIFPKGKDGMRAREPKRNSLKGVRANPDRTDCPKSRSCGKGGASKKKRNTGVKQKKRILY